MDSHFIQIHSYSHPFLVVVVKIFSQEIILLDHNHQVHIRHK